MMPDRTAQDTAVPTRIFPGSPKSRSAAASKSQGVELLSTIRSGQFSKAAAAMVLFAVYTKQPNKMATTMIRLTFLYGNLNSSAAWGIVSNPTKAQGAMAKVERIAEEIPPAP